MNRFLVRDEREVGVDQAADRLSYLALSFGLLAIVAYRSFANREPSWDLLGLVLLGGAVGTGYRAWQRAISRRWAVVLAWTVIVGLVVAAITVLATRT
jgi:hypothetical protein